MSTDETRFEEALDRWGTNFSDWPTDTADWGRRLVEESEAARRAHEQALRIEGALGALSPLPASADLKQRIVDAAEGERRYRKAPRRSLWRPALAAAIPLLVGFWLGLNQGHDDAATTAEAVGLLAFTTNLEEFDYEP